MYICFKLPLALGKAWDGLVRKLSLLVATKN